MHSSSRNTVSSSGSITLMVALFWCCGLIIIMMEGGTTPPFRGAYGKVLSGIITDERNYTSVNDTVTYNAVLNVTAMLQNTTIPSSSKDVLFRAEGLVIDGTLQIILPTSESAWDDPAMDYHFMFKGARLIAVIKNGASHTQAYQRQYCIQISGVLSRGSTITIEGGNYSFKEAFIGMVAAYGSPPPVLADQPEAAATLQIVDGAALVVEGVAFIYTPYPGPIPPARAVVTLDTLTVSRSGVLRLSRLYVIDRTYLGAFYPSTAQKAYNTSIMNITNYLSISHNSIVEIADILFQLDWVNNSIIDTVSVLTAQSSTASPVSDNNNNSSITLHYNSTLWIRNSTIVVGGGAASSSSTVFVKSISIVRVGSTLNVSLSSFVHIHNNTLFYPAPPPPSLNNIRNMWEVPEPVMLLAIVLVTPSLDGVIRMDGKMLVFGNRASYYTDILLWVSDTQLLGSGNILVSRNFVNSSSSFTEGKRIGSIISFNASYTTPTPIGSRDITFYTCGNYIIVNNNNNPKLCRKVGLNIDSDECWGVGSSNIGVLVERGVFSTDCTATETIPITLTPSITLSNISNMSLASSSGSSGIVDSGSMSSGSMPTTMPMSSGSMPTTMPASSPSINTSITTTITPSLSMSHHYLPLCTLSCSDLVALQLLDSDVNPQTAISAYQQQQTTNVTSPSFPQIPIQGCAPFSVTFRETNAGASARLLVHIQVRPTSTTIRINDTLPIVGSVLRSTLSDIHATVVSETISKFGVFVVDIQRLDSSPLQALSTSIGAPHDVFMCTPNNKNNNDIDTDNTILLHTGIPWINIHFDEPPPTLTEQERAAIACISAVTSDLQTVAAIGLLRCSPGSDVVESEAGIRALVPMALSATCKGAVQGALLTLAVIAVIGVFATIIVKLCKKLPWVEAAGIVRCPGLIFAVWSFLQMGLVVCGARLTTAPDTKDAVFGVIGVSVGVALPAVNIWLTWAFISRRCYRYAQPPEAIIGKNSLLVWMRYVALPSYELDSERYPISKAFSSVVAWTRRPSCIWSGLNVIQPIVMMIVVFILDGSTCNGAFISVGVFLLMVGAICHMWFMPHRTIISNHFQGLVMVINAGLMFIASRLATDPLNGPALAANRILSLFQMALSALRFIHTVGSLGYTRTVGKDTLKICHPDGTFHRRHDRSKVDDNASSSNSNTTTTIPNNNSASSSTITTNNAAVLSAENTAKGTVHHPSSAVVDDEAPTPTASPSKFDCDKVPVFDITACFFAQTIEHDVDSSSEVPSLIAPMLDDNDDDTDPLHQRKSTTKPSSTVRQSNWKTRHSTTSLKNPSAQKNKPSSNTSTPQLRPTQQKRPHSKITDGEEIHDDDDDVLLISEGDEEDDNDGDSGEEGSSLPPRPPSFFLQKKRSLKQLGTSIYTSFLQIRRGNVPMERPYSLLWKGDVHISSDDEGEGSGATMLETIVFPPTNETSTTKFTTDKNNITSTTKVSKPTKEEKRHDFAAVSNASDLSRTRSARTKKKKKESERNVMFTPKVATGGSAAAHIHLSSSSSSNRSSHEEEIIMKKKKKHITPSKSSYRPTENNNKNDDKLKNGAHYYNVNDDVDI